MVYDPLGDICKEAMSTERRLNKYYSAIPDICTMSGEKGKTLSLSLAVSSNKTVLGSSEREWSGISSVQIPLDPKLIMILEGDLGALSAKRLIALSWKRDSIGLCVKS